MDWSWNLGGKVFLSWPHKKTSRATKVHVIRRFGTHRGYGPFDVLNDPFECGGVYNLQSLWQLKRQKIDLQHLPPKNSMETSRAKAKVETCHFNFGLSTTEPQKPTKLPCVGPPSRQRTRPWRRREASQTWKEGSWWQNLHHLIWEDYKSKGLRIKGYAGFLPPTVISWSYVFIFT